MMTSANERMLTLARADVAELLAREARGMLGTREVVETARKACELSAGYTSGTWGCVSYSLKPILF